MPDIEKTVRDHLRRAKQSFDDASKLPDPGKSTVYFGAQVYVLKEVLRDAGLAPDKE